MNSMKRQKDMTLKDEPHRLVGVQYATREVAPEGMKKLSQSGNNAQVWIYLVMKVKVQCYKEQYCTGTWNIRSMNQSKLEVVKQEMARVNIDILGISELK